MAFTVTRWLRMEGNLVHLGIASVTPPPPPLRGMYGGQILVNGGLQEAYEELKATAKEWYPQLEEGTEKQAKEPAET